MIKPFHYILNYANIAIGNIKKIIVYRHNLFGMPIQAPSWTDFLICPACQHDFSYDTRAPITLGCGHTICKLCLISLNRKQCPYDQTNFTKDLDNFPINYALLQLITPSSVLPTAIEDKIPQSTINTLSSDEFNCLKHATQCIEQLALYLKPNGNTSGLLTRPMQRKLVTLINCQLIEDEGRSKSLRAARSLGERAITELILQHQNQQQLSANLWAAVRARGCQFLGPHVQEEVLRLVLLVLENGDPLSRKVLVLYVVQKLEKTFNQASKTSIGHVVQLLYRASCFKVSKREGDSSLMTLKEEFRNYDALRREHDTQIVQIATEAGLRIAPDQWSSLLYGDANHKSHMQSIIDKQQSPQSFIQSVNELVLALQRTGDPANLTRLRTNMEFLANIDPSSDPNVITMWDECNNALNAVKLVVDGLVDFVQNHGNRKLQETNNHLQRYGYKVSLCREKMSRGSCQRGQSCNFAHSNEELEQHRAKSYKNNQKRPALNQTKEPPLNYNVNVHNGPNAKVNINMPFAKTNQDTHPNSRFPTKSTSYHRSENHSPMTSSHHLRPTNVYSNSTSSTSTPNLPTLPLSPNLPKINSPNGPPQFSFNGTTMQNYPSTSCINEPTISKQQPPYNYRPPLSAPPAASGYANMKLPNNNNFSAKKQQQLSPYHNVPMLSPSSPSSVNYSARMNNSNNNNNSHSINNTNINSNGNNNAAYFALQPPPQNYFNTRVNNAVEDGGAKYAFNNDTSKNMNWNRMNDKQKSPNHLMPTSPYNNQHLQQQQQQQFNSQQMMKPTNVSSNNNLFNNDGMSDYAKRNVNINRFNLNNTNNALPSNLINSLTLSNNSSTSNATIVAKHDEIDGIWNYSASQQQQPQHSLMKSAATASANTSAYQFMPSNNASRDKFLRSDSILNSNTDDSFDNLSVNGKYGAIGIKTNEANQWSGLQQNRSLYDNFDLDINASLVDTIACNFESSSMIKKSNNVAASNVTDQMNAKGHDSRALNGNFLSMPTSDKVQSQNKNASSDLEWKITKKDLNADYEAIEDRLQNMHFWNFINE